MSTAAAGTGNLRAPLKDRRDDLYETPVEAVLALIKAEGARLPKYLWEPACGRGAIVEPLLKAKRHVIASDLVDYGTEWQHFKNIDFLLPGFEPVGIEGIVTNPPYKLAEEFVFTALERAPYVAMLLRLGFLAGVRKSGVLDGGNLARVHVFKNRLPMMHRDGWDGPRTGSQILIRLVRLGRRPHRPDGIESNFVGEDMNQVVEFKSPTLARCNGCANWCPLPGHEKDGRGPLFGFCAKLRQNSWAHQTCSKFERAERG